MYVCMCIGMYVCVWFAQFLPLQYVRMYVHVYVCTAAGCVCMHVGTHVCMYVRACVYVCMYVHLCMCVGVYVCKHVCMYVCV